MISCLLALLIFHQVASNEHTADTIPNSLTNPTTCRADQSGYVCDVDGMLPNFDNTTKGVKALNDAILEIQKNTTCLCPQATQCLRNVGTTISVVVVEKLKMAKNETTPEKINEALQKVADEVRARQARGRCDDDILILLSVGQNAVKASYGKVVAEKINAEIDKEIMNSAADEFEKKNWTSGMLEIVNNCGRGVRGEKIEGGKTKHWYDPIPFWGVVGIGAVLGVVLLLIVVAFVLFLCRKNQGYTMGQRN